MIISFFIFRYQIIKLYLYLCNQTDYFSKYEIFNKLNCVIKIKVKENFVFEKLINIGLLFIFTIESRLWDLFFSRDPFKIRENSFWLCYISNKNESHKLVLNRFSFKIDKNNQQKTYYFPFLLTKNMY